MKVWHLQDPHTVPTRFLFAAGNPRKLCDWYWYMEIYIYNHMVVCIPQWLHKLPDTYVASFVVPQRRHLEPPGWRTATQSARWSWSAAGSEPSQHAYHPERSRYDPRVARQIGRGQTEVRGRKVTFPVEVPRGRRFFWSKQEWKSGHFHVSNLCIS